MSSYYYKTTAPAVLEAVSAWDAKLAEFHAQRVKLGRVFGAEASAMYFGSENDVGGVKLGAGCELDVHWRRPDEYGYRTFRNTAKPERGATKEARATYKAEHDRLFAL